MNSTLGFTGKLTSRKISITSNVDLRWKLKNNLKFSFLVMIFINWFAKLFSRITGVITITSTLSAVLVKADGRRINFGVICRRVVTDAGVAFLVDDWDTNAQDITTFNFHASGTGTGSPVVGDTALGAEATTITDRATGTKSQPSANILKTVGTQTYTNSGAITEHGLFSVVTESTGTLWDRHTFTAINVINTDAIEWTYELTVNSGG